MRPGRNTQVDFGPLLPVLAVGHGVDSDVKAACCRVRSSILSPNVTVHEGAEVADSILFEGVEVRSGARLKRVIIDKHAAIPERLAIGFDEEKDGRVFKISRGGVRIVPKNWASE